MALSSYRIVTSFSVGMVFGIIFSFWMTIYSNTDLYLIHIPSYRPRTAGANLTEGDDPRVGVPPPGERVPPMLNHTASPSPAQAPSVDFNVDRLQHQDDDAVARKLFNETRVLVWVMTYPGNLENKTKHVRDTWAKRFNKAIFVSDTENKDFPTVNISVEHGRQHLTKKTMSAFDYVYQNHFGDADWFMKADDDTYVIAENLRYMLSEYSPKMPIYFGHHFKLKVEQGYHSGGAGYVISKEALRRFGNRKPGTCAEDSGAEDVQFGLCMEKLGVKPGDSRDSLGRNRFHCFYPEMHLGLVGSFPKWYIWFNKHDVRQGLETVSDYAISFHYVSAKLMNSLEFYIYHLRPYGINYGLQNLNKLTPTDNNNVTHGT